MKRILCLLFLVLLLPQSACTETPDYTDDTAYPRFVGRLYIPDVGIDVALYRSNKQGVVDRKDSAAYFDLNRWKGHMLIADHWTEAFATLKDVTVGMEAYIQFYDGEAHYYECIDVFDGHNTGKYITDWSYKNVVPRAELLMYTCFDGWRNVKVTLWETCMPRPDQSPRPF